MHPSPTAQDHTDLARYSPCSVNRGVVLFSLSYHDLPRIPIAFSASVTLPNWKTLLVSPFNILSRSFRLLRFSSSTRCSSFPLLITWTKKVARRLRILFISDLVVLASRNTVSFDFFEVDKIRSIHLKNHISVASSFFCTCFEIVEASHPYIRTGSI